MILPISVSQIARIIGKSHQYPAIRAIFAGEITGGGNTGRGGVDTLAGFCFFIWE
jgi:hypothetical protein